MHSTMAKNACGLRHGYSPETLVFGKGLRVPGSLASDDSLPAHAIANAEGHQGVWFRELLAKRETARKAFHAADMTCPCEEQPCAVIDLHEVLTNQENG